MEKKSSLIYAYLLDGQGGGKKIKWADVNSWTPKQGLLWLHFDISVPRTYQWLKKDSGLEKVVCNALVAEETRPRSVIYPEGLLVFLRGVNSNPQEEPEDMVSIRIWIDKHRIITTRKRSLLSVEDICQDINEGHGPKTSTQFLFMLADFLTHRMSEVVESINDQVDDFEHEVISSQSQLLRPKIAHLRREAIMLRRYLAPQRDALNKLYYGQSNLIEAEEKVFIFETTDRVIRCIEELDAVRERATITQEEVASRIAEQMNKRMYALSVVAVIFIPLSFITGILGINVGGIPGQNNPWAFLIVCGLLVIILAVMFWFFRKFRWI